MGKSEGGWVEEKVGKGGEGGRGRKEGRGEEGRTCKDEAGEETKDGAAGNVYHAPIFEGEGESGE